MEYEVIVIGAGLAGLTAASLLAKRGISVAVVDKSYQPGGSCGIFKRENVIFDQGSSMLFGFGEKGFNPHRFVFNCLEEKIQMIKHEYLYCVNYRGKKIKFWADVDKFVEELSKIFPNEQKNIKRFYQDMQKIYQHVMVETPVFSTPDEADKKASLRQLLRHPISYAKFLSSLNKSTKSLLEKYFSDPEIFKFFDKLMSTYCYTTVEETPAILAAVMFIDNHVGGSYYPAGSSVFLPGKLEKVIEEHNGQMLMEQEVEKLIFAENKPVGVKLKSGQELFAKNIIYSGTVWNLYGKLIPKEYLTPAEITWAANLVPTYPSMVLYAYVDKAVIPIDTLPIELLVGNPDKLDESEVTVYIPSLDDATLCEPGGHVVMAIGPSFEKWENLSKAEYLAKKQSEQQRLEAVLEERFPGIKQAIRFVEVATPKTIERYTDKNNGSVAGPKQLLGQHMLKRLHTKSKWESLCCCGESTVMGTGTPAVTVSGLSAANAILKKLNKKEFVYQARQKNYVEIVAKPFPKEKLYASYPAEQKKIMLMARECQLCESPDCMKKITLDIRGIMRRVSVGNFLGAKKLCAGSLLDEQELASCQNSCIQNTKFGKPIEIVNVISYLQERG